MSKNDYLIPCIPMNNLDYIYALKKNYERCTVSTTMSPAETMNNQWYFEVGRGAVDNVLLALACSKLGDVKTVLDLPCGHGRVLRHLACLFPRAKVHACDLDRTGVDFCAATFGATPLYSQEELTRVNFGAKFDLIWVGSLFTHTARDLTRRWAAHLARFLSPQGIVIATVHGRWCEEVHKTAHYIAEDRWQEIVRDYRASGYGYRDYPKTESHSFISGSYGIALAKPHAILEDLETIPGIRVYLYVERGWADHQDVVAFGRPAYNEPWPGKSA